MADDGLGGVERDADLVLAAHLVGACLFRDFFEREQTLALVDLGIFDEGGEVVEARSEAVEVRAEDGVELAEVGEATGEVEGEGVERVGVGGEGDEEVLGPDGSRPAASGPTTPPGRPPMPFLAPALSKEVDGWTREGPAAAETATDWCFMVR